MKDFPCFSAVKGFLFLAGLLSVVQALVRKESQDQLNDPTSNSVGIYQNDLLFDVLRESAGNSMQESQTDNNQAVLDSHYDISHLMRPRPMHKLGHFSWKTCGSASDPLQISNLTLSPDPIKLGTPIKLTISGRISTQLTAPIAIDVVVQKKVYVWVTLPCVDDLGSCSYADVCARLPPPPCPPPVVAAGLPCTCPIPAGTYAVNDLEVEIDTRKYPGWLTEGDFKAKIALTSGSKSVGCYEVELNIISG